MQAFTEIAKEKENNLQDYRDENRNRGCKNRS